MTFKLQKRTLLLGTIFTLIITSVIFTYFVHHNHESTKIQLIEDKLKGDSKSILPHLFLSGNSAWFKDNLNQYKKMGLKCLSVIDLQGKVIWGDGPCSLKITARNYTEQKVFDISYDLPSITLMSSIKANGLSFSIFFLIELIFLTLAYKLLSLINRRHSDALVQIEHIKGVNETNEKVLRLTKTLSHNLKSPLAALKALGELASERLNEEDINLLNSIQERIDAMASRLIEQDEDEAPISVTNISESLERVVDIKRLEYSKKPLIEIRSSIEKNIYSFVNRDELLSIISNLVNNSIEAKKDKSFIVIEIAMSLSGEQVIIEVKDNGTGVAQNQMNKIFNYGHTTKKNGKGCGLSHARHILSLWKGDISIESSVGVGTTVKVSLPISQKTKNIILIDDEPLNILSWRGMAKKNDIHFTGYADPLKFFENIPEEKEGTAIYVDYDLAGIDGAAIARQIKKMGFRHVCLATGHSEIIDTEIAQVGKEFPMIKENNLFQ